MARAICFGAFVEAKRISRAWQLKNYKQALREAFEHGDYYDDHVRQLISENKLKVSVSFVDNKTFKITVSYDDYSKLDEIVKSIAISVWKWEAEYDEVPFKLGYLSCALIRKKYPVEYFIEDSFSSTNISIEEYKEAIAQGKYWNCLSSDYKYVKELYDKRVISLSVKVFDDHRFRVVNKVLLENELVKTYMNLHPHYDYDDKLNIKAAEESAYALYEAVKKMENDVKFTVAVKHLTDRVFTDESSPKLLINGGAITKGVKKVEIRFDFLASKNRDLNDEEQEQLAKYYEKAIKEKKVYFDYLDSFYRQLIESKVVDVDFPYICVYYTRVSIETKADYTHEELEKIAKAIINAIYQWEIDTQDAENKPCKLETLYLLDDKPIRFIVENSFRNTQGNINEYREAIKRGEFFKYVLEEVRNWIYDNSLNYYIVLNDDFTYRVIADASDTIKRPQYPSFMIYNAISIWENDKLKSLSEVVNG